MTRFVHGLATSLHLSALKGVISAGEKKISKAMRFTDLAATIKFKAEQARKEAIADWRAAQDFERQVRRNHSAVVQAAVAEADGLAREHSVGA